MLVKLRPYQEDALNGVRRSLATGHDAPILVAPTGAGKTVCASGIIEGAVSRERTTLFLAHRYELIAQASLKLASYGITHNVVAPAASVRQIMADQFRMLGRSYVDKRALTTVGTVQTQSRRLDQVFARPDLIIIDECHLSIAPTYFKVVEEFNQAKLIGLTATPTRLDGKGLGKHAGGLYDDLVMLCQPSYLMGQGFLVPAVFYASKDIPDVSQLRTVRGDYDQQQAGEVFGKPKIIGDAVEHYRTVAHGRPAIAFCPTVKHAEDTAAAFRAAGYRAVAVSGDSDPAVRNAAVAGLGNGSVDAVCNCGLYIEGLDQPAIKCVIMLAPTKSLTRYLQSVGRGLRPYPDGGWLDCVVLDHVGNCYQHGFPEDDREWTLDGAEKGRRAANDNTPVDIMTCKVCFTIHKPAPACPGCGHVYPVRQREIQQEDGELIQLTADTKAQVKARQEAEKLAAQKKRKSEEAQCKTEADLVALGRQRGYDRPEAWAKHKMAARQKKAANYRW